MRRGVSYFQGENERACMKFSIHSFLCHSDQDCQGEENIEKRGRKRGRRKDCLTTSNVRDKKKKLTKKKKKKNGEIPRRETVGTTVS